MSVGNTHHGATAIKQMLCGCKSIYFIGIGGINMSSLAHITKKRGYEVGGSDRVRTALTERLSGEGIEVFYEHSAAVASKYDAFVYTVAISEDNPEYVHALAAGKPCISRADYLGYIMTEYACRVGIAGMHGKSTCTSMCAQILIDGGYSPTVLSGAELCAMGGAYCVGDGESFVFEACEYMDSFLDFNPTVAVILNMEMDHVDYFKSMEQIKQSYAKYASLVGKNGCVIYNADDENTVDALRSVDAHKISLGIKSNADIMAVNIEERGGKYSFDVLVKGETLCRAELCVSGYHNIYNALAAAAACIECGVDGEDIRRGLYAFCGAARRMEYKGKLFGASVYDDYAHHPTEIAATLSGARKMASGNLICVYQPHTYSRTAALLDEFAGAFGACDKVVFVDIYAAREKNTFGVTSETLARAVGDKAQYIPDFVGAASYVRENAREGDVVIIMGAGDVYKVFGCLSEDLINERI